MKRVIIILFALLPIFAAAQNEGSSDGLINKGSGILYFEGRPNFDPTPFTDASEFAIDLNTKKVYVYSGSGSVWNRYNAIDTLSTLADTANVDNRIGQLVYVNGVDQYWTVNSAGAWELLSSGTSPFSVDQDTIGADQFRLAVGNSGNFPDNSGGFLHIPNRLYFFDEGLFSERNYFFGDIEAWSAAHSNAAFPLANNFHYWAAGGGSMTRVEFENDTAPLQFYIEGIGEAWFGLQNGSSHLWSSGYKTSTTGNDWVWNPAFGLDASPVMRLSQAGNLTITGDLDVEGEIIGLGQNQIKPVEQIISPSIDLESAGNGIYDFDFTSVSGIQNLSFSNPVNGGEYAIWYEGCNLDTLTFPNNFLSLDRDSMKSRECNGNGLFQFFYDGTNFIAHDTIFAEVTIPASTPPTDLLLDNYPATVAYSLRRIRTAYTGNLIEIERTSDNTTLNVGYLASNALDTSAINTFCSGTTCRVRTWYDQSGNGLNAQQTTHASQPIIYAGTVIREGLQPAVRFDGTQELSATDNDLLSATDGAGNEEPISAFFVYQNPVISSSEVLVGKDDGSPNREYAIGTFGSQLRMFTKNAGGDSQISRDASTNTTTHQQVTVVYDGSETATGFQFWRDGVQLTMQNPISGTYTGMSNTTSDLVIGNYGITNAFFSGTMQEIVLYIGTDQTANRSAIETNQADFFGTP